ncbi:arylsulfatase [Parvibaculaceae bacterium PLY_AMNH_Bact1]|nr:arylsulfatase [Parvibaculaceae bacterium PLY_AMNH_Bact1]
MHPVVQSFGRTLYLCGAIWMFMAANASAQTQPNIVILLVDDAGLMDFSPFGGEANMPSIDRLAAEGAMFTGYRTSPSCAPSRAMLLSGVDNHRTGMATIPEFLRPEDKSKPGYSMSLEPGVQTIADRLKAAGYRTYMTGKWHLGSEEGDLPNHHGFDRSFALDASGADNWEQKSYLPFYPFAPWYEDGAPADLPEDFYSSKFLVDKMIDYFDEGTGSDAPFLAYIGFQAIHIPIQAPREFIDKYEGVFDDGWNVLREQRWQRAQKLGLVPHGAPLAPIPERLRVWDDLSDEDKRLYSKSMAVNAAMLEAMDFHIGRLIAHLEASGELENTLFVVTSDNGPEASAIVELPGFGLWMALNGYHYDVERLGEKGSMGFIGPEWAHAAAAPSDLFKFYAAEGGIRVPLIVSGAGVAPQAPIPSMAMVTDITPTIMDFAGVEASDDEPVPINGRSLRPVLDGAAEETHAAATPIGLEVSGNGALLLDGYKITRNMPPFGDGVWRLYDLSQDPGETTDLAEVEPERMQKMRDHYQQYAEEFGVVELQADFSYLEQVTANSRPKLIAQYWWLLLAVVIVIVGSVVLVGRFTWRKLRNA